MSNSTRNWLIVAIVFVAGLGSVLRLDSAEEAKKPAVRKWEYKISNDGNLERFGDEGWELVAATVNHRNEQLMYLKRPK